MTDKRGLHVPLRAISEREQFGWVTCIAQLHFRSRVSWCRWRVDNKIRIRARPRRCASSRLRIGRREQIVRMVKLRIRNVDHANVKMRCGYNRARVHAAWRSLPYKYFLGVDVLAISCAGLVEASIIGFQIIRRPVLHVDVLRARLSFPEWYGNKISRPNYEVVRYISLLLRKS